MRNLAELFDRKSGVIPAAQRLSGRISVESCKYVSRSNAITEEDKSQLSALLQRDLHAEECKLQHVKLLVIGGVERVPQNWKKLGARAVSHDFQQLSTKLFGTLLDIFHVTFDQEHSEFIARANIYSKPRQAKRSRLPVIRTDEFQQEMIRCTDVGKLVVLAAARGPGHRARRVVLPHARGYGEDSSDSSNSYSSESSE